MRVRAWLGEHFTRRGVSWERAEARRELNETWERTGLSPQPPATYGELLVAANPEPVVFSVTALWLGRAPAGAVRGFATPDPWPGRLFVRATRRTGRQQLTVHDGALCELRSPEGALVLQAALPLSGDFSALGSDLGPGVFTIELPIELELAAQAPRPEGT